MPSAGATPSSQRTTPAPYETLDLLNRALNVFGREELALRLGRNTKTISRWLRGTPPPILHPALEGLFATQARQRGRVPAFTFADLFAGIGGLRLGFEAFGGRCVFTSEWNEFSQKTYRANFRDDHEIFGDITRLDDPARQMPDFDVLLAGFPCQPFSIAGVSKKNALGRPHGFACEAQGTLFFDVARIIEARRPRAFLLENVKNLVGHDKGNTFRVIRDVLEQQLGYTIHHKVIDAQHFVPQHRERILIVGYRDQCPFDWSQVRLPEKGTTRIRDILHPEDGSESPEAPFTEGALAEVSRRYVLTDHLWRYLRDYAAKHRAAGHGFGYGMVGPDSVSRTLSARYYKDGSEILVSRGEGLNPRRLTPRECARLMGYPDSFKIPVSDTQAYRQFGNSVVVPVVKAVAGPMIDALNRVGDETLVVPEQLPLFRPPTNSIHSESARD